MPTYRGLMRKNIRIHSDLEGLYVCFDENYTDMWAYFEENTPACWHILKNAPVYWSRFMHAYIHKVLEQPFRGEPFTELHRSYKTTLVPIILPSSVPTTRLDPKTWDL